MPSKTKPIASLALDWANARFCRCTPWCPRLVSVVRDGGWVPKKKRTTRLPRYTRDPVVGVWSKALGDLMRGARSLSRTSFPVPAINSLCSCPSASNNVHGCTQAICAYHRIDDLPEIRIVAARWRPMVPRPPWNHMGLRVPNTVHLLL